jgi:putative pyruvate formate lyase activating enzyme
MNIPDNESRNMFQPEDVMLLKKCTLCPRECKVNRFVEATGYCKTGAGFEVASVSVHKGEEPVISGPAGICNIFFTGCNLRCVFCQNFEISQAKSQGTQGVGDLDDLLDSIEIILSKGISSIGFVSPSHVVPQVKTIIKGLHQRGLHPVTVYKTKCYT